MNELLTVLILASALAGTFGVSYCCAWFCLRCLLAFMPSKGAAAVVEPVRVIVLRRVARAGFLFSGLRAGARR